MSKRLHLLACMTFGVNHHAHLMRADPRDNVNADLAKPPVWQDLARTLERGLLDGPLIADFPGGPVDVYEGRPDAVIRGTAQFPRHDPAPLPVVVTERLGFGLTLSTAFRHPTLPLLAPTLVVVPTLPVVWDFAVFNEISILTKGEPDGGTTTAGIWMVVEGFNRNACGRSSAMALVVAVALCLLGAASRARRCPRGAG